MVNSVKLFFLIFITAIVLGCNASESQEKKPKVLGKHHPKNKFELKKEKYLKALNLSPENRIKHDSIANLYDKKRKTFRFSNRKQFKIIQEEFKKLYAEEAVAMKTFMTAEQFEIYKKYVDSRPKLVGKKDGKIVQ